MRDLGGALRVEDRAEHVRDMREGDDAVLVGEHSFGSVEVDLAVARQRHGVDFITGELPRDDVAVVLELRERTRSRPSSASVRATRLIASVAPRVNTSSFGCPPIRFDAAARAAS